MGGRRIALLIGAVIAVGLGGRAWLGHGAADAHVEVTRPPARRDARVLTAVLEQTRTAKVAIDDAVADEVPALELSDEDAEAEIDTGDGLTDEQRWEGVVAEVEDKLPPNHGAIQGRVRDVTGEELAGVTVVAATANVNGVQAAITDEHGFYVITDLVAGEYHVTFYYLEHTIERDVVVGAGKATPVLQSLIPRPRPTVEEIVSGVTSLENHYVIEGEDP